MEKITSNTDPFDIGMMLGTLPPMDEGYIECPQCHACEFLPDDGQTVCDDCDETNSYELAIETREDY